MKKITSFLVPVLFLLISQFSFADAPVLSGSNGYTLVYTENDNPKPIVLGTAVSDSDSATLSSASITISGNYHSAEDVISFTNLPFSMGNIVGSFNASTGVMTLTSSGSTATLAQWQSALGAVRYSNTSDNPFTGSRTVWITVNDGTVDSNRITTSIIVSSNNDSCILSGGSSVSYVENNTPVVLHPSVTIFDIDSTLLPGATISIVGFIAGEVLGYTALPGGITGSYNSGTGVLTLSGNASIADYVSALDLVTYSSTLDNSPATRSIGFAITDGSNTINSTVTIIPVNDAPVVTGNGVVLIYTENSSPRTINPGITVSDIDSATLSSASFTIAVNYQSAEDELSFFYIPATMGNIAGSFNVSNGVLTLTSSGNTATLAQWQAALRAVRYFNTSDNPFTGNRSVWYTVNDGALNSNIITIPLSVSRLNDAPVLSGTSSITYTENSPATVINAAIIVSDVDNTTLSSGTVVLLNYVSSQDILSFTNNPGTMGNIAGSYNAFSGTMSLTSAGNTATLTEWQAALRAVTYINTSDDPSQNLRPVSYTVTDGGLDSNTLNSFITVAAVNDAPIIGGSSSITYIENNPPTIINENISPSDPDSPFLNSASVAIVNFVAGQDVLSVSGLPSEISGNFDSGTGVLTLSGSATVDSYQTVLRSIAYSNTSENPTGGNRNISFSVSDGPLSASITSTIMVFPWNDASVLSESNEITYTENSSAIVINPFLAVSDVDSSRLSSASIAIGNYVSGQDVLSFTNSPGMGNIAGSFNVAAGLLVLISGSGTATLAQWETALRAVRYLNTSDNPSTTDRLIGFTVSDGLMSSNTLLSTITINAINDAPVLSGGGSMISYTENSPLMAINSNISISDIDNATLSYAVATMVNFIQDEDYISFINNPATMGNIAANISSGTVTLTSDGNTATLAEWQAALHAITYGNTSDNPTAGIRWVGYYVNDGSGYSNLINSGVTVIPVNDPPILSSGGASFYVENSPAIAISPSITALDVDNAALASATVVLVNYVSGQDVLSFTNSGGMGNIVGNISSGTVTLTSSGNTATVAEWQAALRAVRYVNISDSPSTTNRIFSFVVNDGMFTSSSLITSILIIPVEDAPVLSGGNTISYVENSSPVVIDNGIVVSDVDSPLLVGATVYIANFVVAEDALSFSALPAGISGSYNLGTGVLTFSGNATVADYQAALRSIRYINTSENPLADSRVVTFFVNDGTFSSNAINSTITVIPVNDAPILFINSALTYTENAAPMVINPDIQVYDLDRSTLATATVSITNYVSGQDVLSFINNPGTMGNITGSFNTSIGILSLFSAGSTATQAQWEAALRSVTYSNTSDSPFAGTRNVSFSINDGIANSNTATSTINVIAVADAPVLSGSSAPNYVENSAPIVINPVITVSDVDNATLSSATITISAYPGEDILSFTNNPGTMGNINGSYNINTFTMNLTSSGSTATLAQWQAALRAVSYFNTSENPATGPRIVGYTVNDGSLTSNHITVLVSITPINDAPVLSGSSTVVYNENTAPAIINPSIIVSDIDGTTLLNATVSITNFVPGQDVLGFSVLPAGITANYNSGIGVLTLLGGSSVADYQSALRSITYSNTSDSPSITARTVRFFVSDGLTSNPIDSTINITTVNDAPVLSGSSAPNYIENSAPIVINPAITVFDVDSTTLSSASITISAYPGEDMLSFTNNPGTMGNINGSYNINTFTMNLTSSGNTATLAQWQVALRAVSYFNTSENPAGGARVVSYTVNDGSLTSSPSSILLRIYPINDAPVLTGSSTVSYTENNAPVVINPSITTSDVDSTTLLNATVSITNFVPGQDVLDFSALPADITGNYNSGIGVLTLLGGSSVANYQSALRSITYSNTSDSPSVTARTVSFIVNDGSTTSNTINSTVNITALSDIPAISGGYCVGATTVSGTSIDGNGTVIDVYKAGATLIGSTTVSGGLWTASVAALSANDMITARATVSGAAQSAASSGVTVNAIANTPTISAGGSTTFCIGDSVTLTAAMPVVTDLSFTAFSTGTHGNDQWQSFVPTVSGATTSMSFYKNGNAAHSGTFTIYSGLGTAGAVVYSQSYSVTNTGVFTINLPNLNLIAGDTYTFRFLGTDVGLIANNGSYGTYFSSTYGTNPGWRLYFVTKVLPNPGTLQWYQDGGILNGATGTTYVASSAGVYTCTNANGICSSNASNGISVTTNALPAAPTINAGGPTTFCLGGSVVLTASLGSSYLWSNGAATQSITVSTAGNYTVQVTNSFGCQSPSSIPTTVATTAQPLWYLDADGDHYYTGTAIPSCTSPGTGYTTSGLLGGGDCNDMSNTVYPNAPEICYNNILENCLATMSQGCAPVVVNMTPSYHNTTLASLSTAIPAVAYSYPGATNLKYRYSITNVTTNTTAPDIIQASRYVTIPASIHLYGAQYTIRASAVINDEVVAFAGNIITVNAPTVQLVTLNTATCGATIATLTSTITANAGLNATGYTFRIRLDDANPSPTYAFSQSSTRFVSANSFTGFPLQYAASYKVAVQYSYNDPFTNQPMQSGYGAECTLNTPSIPFVGLAAPSCGSRVAVMNANISAAAASYATGYQFRIRLFSDNGPTPTYYYSVPNASRFSSLTAFQGITLAYNTAYSISVQYSIVNGGTVWSGYGQECKVTTPFLPVTSLVPSQCGLATATDLNQQLNITPYQGFPHYMVKLEELNGETIVNSQEREFSYSYFKLSDFSIAQLDKNYAVSVKIKLNGVFGDYDTACDLFTQNPSGGSSGGSGDVKNNVSMFKATAYPNPFANNFILDVKTASQSMVNLKVYDMVGRLIEQRNASISDMQTITIGDQYPSGVYNVVVSQEDSVETLRIIKR